MDILPLIGLLSQRGILILERGILFPRNVLSWIGVLFPKNTLS